MPLPKDITSDKLQLVNIIRFRDFPEIRRMVAARKRSVRAQNISAAPLSDSLEYIEAAIIRGDLEVVQYLTDNGALTEDIKNTALHLAAYHGQVKILRQLVLDERQPNVENAIIDFDFLSFADKENFLARSEKYFQRGMDVAQIKVNKDNLKVEIDAFLLVTLGAENPQNKENRDNFTQTVFEAYSQFTRPRRLLNPNIENEYGETALKIAGKFQGNSQAKSYMLKLLQGMESYFNYGDAYSLQDVAMIHISDSMLPAKAQIHAAESGTYSDKGHDGAALYLEMQKKYAEDAEKHKEEAEKRQKEIDDLFLRVKSSAGISQVDLQKFVKKFSINVTDGYQYGQNSLLHAAVGAARLDLVKLFVENGASLDNMNRDGLNAVDYAQKMLQEARNNGSAKLGEYQKISDYFARELPNPIVAHPIGLGLAAAANRGRG